MGHLPQCPEILYFGKKCTDLFVPSLNGTPIEWVDKCNYLGVCLVSGQRFKCSVSDRIKQYYKCANAIFRVEGRSDDLTMLRLVETHCIPVLTYGIEVADSLDHRERSKIRAAYNYIFRQIFGYRIFESVTDLQLSLDLARPTWEMFCESRKDAFYQRLG